MNLVVDPSPSPQFLSSVKEALACGLLGVVLSTGVYGVNVLQAYIYFHNSTQGYARMRYFIALLFSLVYENGTVVLTRALAQCFFAHRLWLLSKRNLALVGSIVFLAVCSFGPGIVISVRLYTDRDISSFASADARVLIGLDNGLSVICDVAIVAALCYYLHSKRTGFRRTESMIDRLIIYAVNRGTLTAICQACEMITAIALPGRFIFLPFSFLGGRLYCTTLLATVNAQISMRENETSVIELGTQVLDRIKTSRSGSGNAEHRGSSADQLEGATESVSTFVLDMSNGKHMDSDVTRPHAPTKEGS